MNRVSSGRYRYSCNGEDSGIEETWEVHEEGSERSIQCVRLAPPIGIRLQVESLEDSGKFKSCAISWEQQTAENSRLIHADYQFGDETLDVFRSYLGSEEEYRDIPLDFVFSPLMRIYNGPVIEQLLDAPEDRKVCVPTLASTLELTRFLLPGYSERRARKLSDDKLKIDGTGHACTRYDYSGGEYSPGTEFWIDPGGTLLRYRWQQDRNTCWDVNLQDYQPAS